MLLHHLAIQAFGPFGGTVEIDFDELNSAGQFLISGATGSGKTSILDAVCFALYGEVPGERQRAKHLRSDHASPDVEPRVTLTLTVAERLVRISRSPAWERPKRRGSGLTLQQASVRLEQCVDGAWQCLSTRLDEAGHLITTWLGMTPVQFTQVALLPQGGFQTFLQSPAAARQAVLQRLFRTDRFERVERWFAEFRRSLNRARGEALHAIDVIAHRLAEVAGAAEPPPADAGVTALVEWAEARCTATTLAESDASAARDQAARAHGAAALRLEEQSALVMTLDRAEAAQRELDVLRLTDDAFNAELQALRAHEHARSLAPLIKASAAASRTADTAAQEAAASLESADVVVMENETLEDLAAQAQDMVRRADDALVLAQKLEGLRATHRTLEQTWRSTAAALDDLRAAAAAIPREQAALADRLQQAVSARVDLTACELELEVATERRDAASELERLIVDLADKTDLRRSHHDRVQNLRQEYQDAREARIEAMASELAGALVVGCSCPVCGSTSHPSPAASGGTVGRRAEERARKKYESAGVELAALDDVIAAARARSETLSQVTQGVTQAEWDQRVQDLQQRRSDLVHKASTVERLRAQATALEQRLLRATAEMKALVETEAHARAQAELLSGQVDDLQSDLSTALGDHPDATTYARRARARAASLQAALDADDRRLKAEAAAAHQRAALDLQARSLGFASGHDAESALLDDGRVSDIARRERDRARTREAATAVLDDPDVLEALRLPRPDLEPIIAEATRAEETLANAQAELRMASNRRERTSAIARELAQEVATYRPLEDQAARVSALSGLLEGTGVDNRLRMRLSAFVLAERLRQVIDAANARLEVISEGRYVLAYQEERGAGESRGGLSLSVLDEWTGVRRDPTTLSGGETFVVSLCLALGLADTVADESGGLRIDTLFIDEGFGSLDAQTLDSVIDILGQLSQGGRVTGVVSHVFELRERMPAVLEVVRSKTGSTVRRATA